MTICKIKKTEETTNETNENEMEQIRKINISCNNYKEVYISGYNKFSKLGNWLEKESLIFKNEVNNTINNKPNFKRGEIIKVDFGINMGSELSNTHFAIVLNSDDNINVDNITVLPLTSKNGYKRLYLGNILKKFNSNKYNKRTYALITQITTISKKKIFNDNIRCHCDSKKMELIDKEIINFLTYNNKKTE